MGQDSEPLMLSRTLEGQGELDMSGLAVILFGASAFQYLVAGCELGLFDLLAEEGLTKAQIGSRLNLAERATDILLLGTTALGLLTLRDEIYSNAAVIRELMTTEKWDQMKAFVGFEQHIAYAGQVDFTESLRANYNVGLRHISGVGGDLYHRLHDDPLLESTFYLHMRSWSEWSNPHLVGGIDYSGVSRVLDVGGGDAVNAIALARAHQHLKITVLEIEATLPIAQKKIAEAGLQDRIDVVSADILADPFPPGYDLIIFVHQLVIWTLEENTGLLRKAYDALPQGGRVAIFNSMSSDAGDGPLMAALDSVYFAALPAEGGMIYSWAQHEKTLRAAGFRTMERVDCPGWTPHGLLVATK